MKLFPSEHFTYWLLPWPHKILCSKQKSYRFPFFIKEEIVQIAGGFSKIISKVTGTRFFWLLIKGFLNYIDLSLSSFLSSLEM